MLSCFSIRQIQSWPSDSQLQHPAAQRARLEPKELGCAGAAFDSPPRRVQHRSNMALLDFDERDARRRRSRLRRRHPGVAERERRAGRQDDRSLQHVLELADVARPVVRLQRLHDVGGNRIDTLVQRARQPSDEMLDELRDDPRGGRAATES